MENSLTDTFFQKHKRRLIKAFFVFTIAVFFLVIRFTLVKEDDKGYVDKIYCFKDPIMLNWFTSVTNYISQDLALRDFMLIFASFLMDILVMFVVINYAFFGNSSKFFFELGFFFFLRGIVIQNLFLLQMYDTYIFDFPGFYSIVVPLFPGPDFFYSGHVGTALLCSLYIRDFVKNKLLFILGIVSIVIQSFVMVVLRAHYVIDLIFGVIVAHYLYSVMFYVSKLVDEKWGIMGRGPGTGANYVKSSKQDENLYEKNYNLNKPDLNFVDSNSTSSEGQNIIVTKNSYERSKEGKNSVESNSLNKVEEDKYDIKSQNVNIID